MNATFLIKLSNFFVNSYQVVLVEISKQLTIFQVKKCLNGTLKYMFFHIHSDIQVSLKFISNVVPTPKFLSIDVNMTSYLQKLRHIFSSSGFCFIAYRFCCGWSRSLKLGSINKWDLSIR